MKAKEREERLNTIIDELNQLNNERENLEGLGAIDLDMALDYRADSWDGDFNDYVPPTPEEIESIKAECERNKAKVFEIDDKIDALKSEYLALTDGFLPHYYDVTNTYARSWDEKRMFDDEEE